MVFNRLQVKFGDKTGRYFFLIGSKLFLKERPTLHSSVQLSALSLKYNLTGGMKGFFSIF